MHDDDSFNDSYEIFNLYSSKKVTETFKTQFQKLISNNPCLENETTNIGVDWNEENEQPEVAKEIDELLVETPPVKGKGKVKKKTSQPVQKDSVLEIVSDPSAEDSIEIIAQFEPRRVTRQSVRLRNKRGRVNTSFNDSDIESPIIPPANKKKARGKRKEKKKSIDEVVLVDSPEPNKSMEEDELNPEVSVKVIWKSVNIKKYKIRKFQKISTIFEELSKEENIPEDKIMLTFNNIKVNRNDTPDSLNLQVYHFLDGGVLSELTNSCNTLNQRNTNPDVNAVTVKFQDVNKKVIKMTLDKNEKMKIVMIKCSEQLEIGLDKIKFFFDGELLDPMETPSSLGLENDEIIDIKICG